MHFRMFVKRLSKANLARAKALRDELGKDYMYDEVDTVYRYFHSGWKVFHSQTILVDYIEAIVSLVGEHISGLGKQVRDYDKATPSALRCLKKLDFDKDFIEIVEDSLKIEFHGGEMPLGEWQRMSAAVYTARAVLESSLKVAEELLSGKLSLGLLEYHQALFYSVWNCWPYFSYGRALEYISRSPNMRAIYDGQIRNMRRYVVRLQKRASRGEIIASREFGEAKNSFGFYVKPTELARITLPKAGSVLVYPLAKSKLTAQNKALAGRAKRMGFKLEKIIYPRWKKQIAAQDKRLAVKTLKKLFKGRKDVVIVDYALCT